MMTFFTTAKPFIGHSGIIQRNALKSWKRLHPDVEVILFGDEEGAAEVCAEIGLRHESHLERDPSGLKYINTMFDRADKIARYDVLCYVNCDIILGSDFLDAVRRVHAACGKFLMVGRRWDTDITEPIDFSNPRWCEETRELARKANDQRDGWWIDYFCFSRKLYYMQIPEFVIGRICWDNWLVWHALHSRAVVVDATRTIVAVHQNHGYSYHPKGKAGVWTDELSKQNLVVAGGWRHQSTILEAAQKLTPNGLKRNWARQWHASRRKVKPLFYEAKRFLTFKVWLPAWHVCLGLTRPIRARLGLISGGRKKNPEVKTLQ